MGKWCLTHHKTNRHMKTCLTNKIMNKKTFYAVAIAVALLSGYSAYNSHSKSKLSDVMLANVEALADGPESSDKEYPMYINKTDKNSYKEFKTEIKADSTGAQITIQYSRTCTTSCTKCKATKTIAANSLIDAHAFLNSDSLTLE